MFERQDSLRSLELISDNANKCYTQFICKTHSSKSVQRFSNSGAHFPSRTAQCGAEGGMHDFRNRHTYTIFTDNDIIS